MEIKLKKVLKKEIKKLQNMIQLYMHDISFYFPIDFDSMTGLYNYGKVSKYFNNTDNYAYFILVENQIGGFILVDTDQDNYIIQEMFVLNNFKNKGIGNIAVSKIFDIYKSNWIVKSLPGSVPAEKFWIKAIKEYTNDNYSSERVGNYNRMIFKFNNSEK